MSLENPTIIEKGTAFVKAYRIWFIIAGLIVALLLVWWGISAGQTWYGNRQIDKLKANVNTALQAVNAAQANVQQDKIDEAVKLEQVKAATNQYVAAVNATDAARTETNRALTNLSSAVNANRPVGTTADDLQKQLDDLDK